MCGPALAKPSASETGPDTPMSLDTYLATTPICGIRIVAHGSPASSASLANCEYGHGDQHAEFRIRLGAPEGKRALLRAHHQAAPGRVHRGPFDMEIDHPQRHAVTHRTKFPAPLRVYEILPPGGLRGHREIGGNPAVGTDGVFSFIRSLTIPMLRTNSRVHLSRRGGGLTLARLPVTSAGSAVVYRHGPHDHILGRGSSPPPPAMHDQPSTHRPDSMAWPYGRPALPRVDTAVFRRGVVPVPKSTGGVVYQIGTTGGRPRPSALPATETRQLLCCEETHDVRCRECFHGLPRTCGGAGAYPSY